MLPLPLRRLATLVACLPLAAAPGNAEIEPPGPDAPPAAEVLDAARAAYAAATTYADEGEAVTSVALPGKPATEMTTRTGTGFERGVRFYFTASMTVEVARPGGGPGITTPERTSRLWADAGGVVRSAGHGQGPEAADSLGTGLLMTAGTAGQAATLVPSLLDPPAFEDHGGGPLAHAKPPELLGEEEVGGVACWVLGIDAPGGVDRLHVGRDDFLIRRVSSEGPAATELTLRPVLNPPAADWDLPPKPEVSPPDPATAPPPLPPLADALPDAPAAAGLFDTSAAAYAAAATYAGEGVVEGLIVPTGRDPHASTKPFRTAFERGGRFYFRYSDAGGPPPALEQVYEVWRLDGTAYSRWSLRPGLQEADSLGLALAGAHGVSGGVAALVPSLLDPDAIGLTFYDGFDDARVTGREAEGGSDCWRIGALRGDDARVTLWLGVEDHLLRRLDERTNFADFHSESTITWTPRLDPAPATLGVPPLPEPGAP